METFELSNELIEKVSQLISKRKNSEIKKIVDGFHYADLAEIIDELDENQRIYLIKLIDSDKTSDILTELDEDVREKILKTLSCLLYTSPSPRDLRKSRMPSSA